MNRKQFLLTGCVVASIIFIIAGITVMRFTQETRAIEDNELYKSLPDILVRTEVISVSKPKRGWLESTLEINRVYKGPTELLGKKFTVESTSSGQGGTGMVYPPLQKGEVGIWQLYEKNGKLLVRWGGMAPTQVIPVPSRKGISKRYEQVKATAEAIQTVVNAPKDKSLKLLRYYVRSQIPEVSVCAIHIIAGLKDQKLMQFLKDLLDEELAVYGQVAIDEALSGAEDGQAWQCSSRRKHLLKRWVSEKMNYFDACRVVARLDDLAQHPGELDYPFILELVKTAIANEGIPVTERRSYLFPLRWIYEHSELGDECFDYLVELVARKEQQEIRIAAAYAIRNFVDLDQNRITVLEKAIGSLEDRELVEVITDAVNKKKEIF